MNTNKLKEALAELQHERSILDQAIANIQTIIATVNGGSQAAHHMDNQMRTHATSYIDDTVAVLELSQQPLHIVKISQKIAEIRGKEVARASVESSIIRHISSLKNRARIIKVKRAHFGLPSWKAIIREPQASSAA